MNQQYLEKEILITGFTDYFFDINDLISADSYNEELLLQKFQQFPKVLQLLLFLNVQFMLQ